VKKFLGGREPVRALQQFLKGNVSLSNVTPVLILRCYMLFGLVPAVMKVRIKYLEILQQAKFESACKHLGAQLGGLFSRHAKSLYINNICALVAFDRAPRSV